MIGKFLRTHRAIYGDRDRVYRAAIGEDCGLVSPWPILGVGVVMLGALDLWLFGGAPLLDDDISPLLPWNILLPQVVIWIASVTVIVVVMAVLGAPARPVVVARLWAYVMGHVATIAPLALLAVLAIRSLLFDAATIERPLALLLIVVSFAIAVWLGAGLRTLTGRRVVPAVAAVALSLAAGVAIAEIKRSRVSRFYDIEYGSMRPGFDRGDRILVSRVVLMVRKPRPGDIVVHNVQADRGGGVVSRVHRIVGAPGDRIRFAECGVIINERAARTADRVRSENPGLRTPQWTMPETVGGKSFLTTFDDARDPLCQRAETIVPPGHFFVAGDARDRSLDSRSPSPGLVRRDAITGIAIFVYASSRPSRRL